MSKKVIVCMTHTTTTGLPKIVKECATPLTAPACVDLIVTDLAVIEVTPNGLVLREVAPGWTADEVRFWALYCSLGLILLLAVRWVKRPLVIPAVLGAGLVAFVIGMLLTGSSIEAVQRTRVCPHSISTDPSA